MNTGVFTALINPGMSLIFSASFFLLWRHQRDRRFIAVLSAAFLAISIGFFLQYFTLISLTFSKLVSNLLLLLGAVGLAAGTFSRFKCRPRLSLVYVAALTGYVAFAWFIFIDPDITSRIYAINFAAGAICLLITAELRRSPRTFHLIDKLLLGLLIVFGLGCFIRPILAVMIEGPYTSYERFHETIYWTTMSVATSLFLLLIALLLVTAIALDLMDQLKRESLTDPLSGLFNRRGLEEGAEKMVRTATLHKMPLTVVICDIDHFKSINDTYGHACGDAVIAAFAHCLRDFIGPHHLCARIGGEEFAILLHGANAALGRLFAESLRTTLSVMSLPCLPDERRLSASFGVAEWTSGEDLYSVLLRADDALYQAKNAGRDRVHVARREGSAQDAPSRSRLEDSAAAKG